MFSEEPHKNGINQDFYDNDADFLNDFEKTLEINKLPINDNSLNSLYFDTELPGEIFKQNPDDLVFPPYPKGKGR